MNGVLMIAQLDGLAEFFSAVSSQSFLFNALLAGLLASIACGVVGTYIVVRRITYIAGAIAHCVLGGLGTARYLQRAVGWEWVEPLYGAVVAAVLAAVVIGWVSIRFKQREDTVISAVWALGMAGGIIMLNLTPGYNEDLMSYLFGNILMVSTQDLWLIAGLDVVVVVIALVFYHQFLAICFDEQFARTRGLPVEMYYMLLLVLTALTVVLLVSIVGVVLVIALLGLPVAAASAISKNLWQMMLLSILLTALSTAGGLAISYGPNLPAGATIVLVAGGVYLLVNLLVSLIRRKTKPLGP